MRLRSARVDDRGTRGELERNPMGGNPPASIGVPGRARNLSRFTSLKQGSQIPPESRCRMCDMYVSCVQSHPCPAG